MANFELEDNFDSFVKREYLSAIFNTCRSTVRRAVFFFFGLSGKI